MKLELFDDDGNYIPNPSEVRPIQEFKKPFWNATIKGDIITFEFIPRDDEDYVTFVEKKSTRRALSQGESSTKGEYSAFI